MYWEGPNAADNQEAGAEMLPAFFMADLNKLYKTAAPIFLLLGIATILDNYVPGLTIPGEPMTWAAFAIACALVAK